MPIFGPGPVPQGGGICFAQKRPQPTYVKDNNLAAPDSQSPGFAQNCQMP